MRRIFLLVAIPILIPTAPARAEEPIVKKVRKSLDEGIKYLKDTQKDDGGRYTWENSLLANLQPGGTSCLAMLALLTAGVPADDPVIKRGLPYIRGLEARHTYVVGLQTMVLAEVGDVRDLNRIQSNVDWLLNAAVTRGGKLGAGGKLLGWTYSTSTGNHTDNSNTQYALLGLWAGRQAGAIINKSVWDSIRAYYTTTQVAPMLDQRGQKMAGWGYADESPNSTLTMTAAGVSGLFISGQDSSNNNQEFDEKTGVAAKCGFYPEDDAIAKGLRWLAKEFRFMNEPHTFYNVYGIERVGRLSGQRFIGEHDWYREGCEYLTGIKESKGLAQKSDGRWEIPNALDQYPIISTSFALLFLAKGRTPILISKLAWDPPGERPGVGTGWNRKHSDARHLVEYCSRELFKKLPLAWQVFDPRQADLSTDAKFNDELSTLLQSPILYMNGHEAPVLTAAQKKLLRRYVDEGGFILAEACCGSEAFAAGFRKLMADKDVFGDESPLMPLDASHPIWSSHALIPAKVFQGENVPAEKKVQAIERGCKTVVVFIPQPLAGYWEDDRFAPKVGEAVGENRSKLAYRLAGNIIAYATGMEPPKPRLDRPKVLDPKDDKPTAGARYQIELAQVKHDGGDWQPAKNAMRALALNARDKYLIDVALAKREVRMTNSAELWSTKFVYMHGKAKFTTEEGEVQNMKAHLDSGATLLADACCGSEAFDEAFREFAKKLYPDQKLEVIPADDLLYSERLNGEAITKLRCRTEKADKSPEATFKDVPPMLEGIKIDGRWAVIYSRYDIGCALEKNKSSACKGYEPESAMKLATAALLYSLKR
ncbi:MAG TPA: DUF4159 domain-containing protein [Gemmataceae bacterium]|jgi:hypothetical protein|nr:DUF4159 domain-containing protein [Gemmataceae bacterium]